jgi:cytidylate kinase
MTRVAPAFGDAVALGFMSMTGLELAAPVILIAVLAAVGAWSARRDFWAFLKLLRRGCLAALVLFVPGFILVAWFVYFDPETISGIKTSTAQQTSWILSMSLFGAGLSMLAGVAAYGLGGGLSSALRSNRRANLVIAIDGPAASGKGTLAKRIAAHYGLGWLDTGLLYRAVARDVAANGGSLEDVGAAISAARAIDCASLADPGLRGPRAGDAASMVAKIPEVRAALLEFQRAFARQGAGAVLDGRDIGSVVCPDANVKIFVTASDEVRARRRHLEHQARGETLEYEELLADIRRRDARDSSRNIAPLAAAPDAIFLDTTNLDADQTFEVAVKMIEARAR